MRKIYKTVNHLLIKPYRHYRLFGFIFLVSHFQLNGQLFSDHNYKFKTFTVQDGLPHNKINKVLQDSKGFIWIATEGGLSRFDGFSFKNFKHSPVDSFSLPADNILDLAIDANDKLWLAYGHGFCSFDPTTFIANSYSIKGSSISAQNIIYNPSDHHVYIASVFDGLFKINIKNNSLQKTSLSRKLHHNVTSASIDSKGQLWLTIERHGFYKYKLKEDKHEYIESFEWPMFVEEDSNKNHYYTGTWLGEFMIFDGSRMPDQKMRHVLPSKFEGYDKVTYYGCAKAPLITGEDILWVVTQAGIGLFDLSKNKFIKYISYHPQNIDGLSNNWTTKIFIDNDGQIWISSWFGLISVNRVAQSFAKYYLPELDINLYNLVSGIENDPHDKNKVWMAVNGSGLAEYDKQHSIIKKWHFKEFQQPVDINYNKRWCHNIKRDSNGVLWVGSYGGYAKIKEGKVTFIDTWVDGSPNYANDIFQDNQGMLWALGRYLQKFNPYTEKFESYQLPKEYITNNIFIDFIAAADGADDELFVGNEIGLFKFNKVSHTFSNIKIEINKNTDKALNNIRALIRINDKLFIGTYSGLLEYNTKSQEFKQHLTDFIEIRGMTKDRFNNLWVYCTQGLYRMNAITGVLDKFDQNDGVYNLSTDPADFFEYQQEMYLGHRGVVTKFNPENIYDNNSIPIPYITEISCPSFPGVKNSKSLINLILKYNESDINFNYTAIEYNYPKKLKFSYFLEGYDKSWSEFTNLRSKSYTNLPHGSYVFKVKSKNNVGLESKIAAEFAFTVQPAVWQTWWFALLCCLGIIGLVYVIFKNRIGQIRKREKEKTEANKLIAELDAKLLRSQMNPHFIFNSLNSIQKYIWENNEEDAAEYLSKFAKLMRSILENSNKEFIPIEEEFQTLKIYLELEHKRSNGHFDYFINIAPDVNQKKVLTPPLLLQPFIENAIWHGLNKSSSHGNLNIEVYKEDDKLIFVVDDDGVGRAKNTSESVTNEKKSMGITITKLRIEKLFDATKTEGKIEIIDKENKGVNTGTRVIISIPFKQVDDA